MINPVDIQNLSNAGRERRSFRRTIGDRLHSPSRERILREIEQHRSCSVAELVASTGLHENTVRGHLGRLEADGYIRQETLQPVGRGRPAISWHIIPQESLHPYAGLAGTLAEALNEAHPDAASLVRQAGVRWGKELAQQYGGEVRSRKELLNIIRVQGFAPEDTGEEIHLHQCPFLAAASQYPKVVCAAHEGMLEGMIQTQSAESTAQLQPFATTSTCILHLRAAS